MAKKDDKKRPDDNKQSGRNKKRYKKRPDFDTNTKKPGKITDENPKVGGDEPNDASWYAPNPALLNAAASIPFSSLQGLPIDLWETNLVDLNDKPFPGVAQLSYVHSLGCGDSVTDAPTMAARYIYSWVRHANSGSRNYEAPDMYMYIMAWCSAAAVIEEAKRVYGTMRAFIPKNRFYPAAIVSSMGGKYVTLQGDLPNFRAAINLMVAKLNSLKVPAGMPILDRWKQLANTYYTDGKSAKAQLYVPKLLHALKWEQTALETGSALSYYNVATAFTSVNKFVNVLDELLGAMLGNEDLGIMSGDVLKAYGESGCAAVSYVEDDYICVPVESDEMLYQIHNAEFAGNPTLVSGLHAWQTPEGIIKSEITFNDSQEFGNGVYNAFWRNAFLDVFEKDPTPERVITATRWMLTEKAASTQENAPESIVTLKNTGSEVMCYARVISEPDADPLQIVDPIITTNTVFRADTVTSLISDRACAAISLSSFDFAPVMWFVVNAQGGTTSFQNRTLPMTNIENYTFVDRSIIARMNHIAMLNMLATSTFTPFK